MEVQKQNPSLRCALSTAKKPVPSGITPSLAHQQLHCMGIPCSGIILGFLGSDSCISKNMQVLCNHIALPMRTRNWWQRPSRKSSNKLPELLNTALRVKKKLYNWHNWCIKTKCQRPKTIHQIIHVHHPGALFQSERPETIKWSTSLLIIILVS